MEKCSGFKHHGIGSLAFILLTIFLCIPLQSYSSDIETLDSLDKNYFSYSQDSLAILQGATGFNSTQLAVLVKTSDSFIYSLKDSQGHDYQGVTRRHANDSSEFAIDQLQFKDLPSGMKFVFSIFSPKGDLVDQRFLRTFDQNQEAVKVVVASCMSDSDLFYNKNIWEGFAQENPDLAFFLGDNVYASISGAIDPKRMWKRYVETRAKLIFFKMKNHTPVFAILD